MADTYNYGGEETRQVDTGNIKCEKCGGEMVFDPATQKLVCDHCGNTVDIEKNFNVKENDIEDAFDKAEKWDKNENTAYRCENCGAVIYLNKGEVATRCPFCGTPNVVETEEMEGIKPQVVIPFLLGIDKAEMFSRKWAKSRLFAPKKFKKNLQSENMRGVYEPAFTFDSRTFSRYVGRVGDRHTRTVGSGKNQHVETYIVYRNVSGSYNQFFDDVFVACGEKFGQNNLNKVGPFRTAASCVYEKKYLTGFMANRYEKDLKTSWQDAKVIIDSKIRQNIISSCHCDTVDYLNVSTHHENVTYKYMLLPVYICNYNYKGKAYNIYINGSTGKVSGKTPVSALRVGIAVLIGLGIAALIAVLYHLFAGGNYTHSDYSIDYLIKSLPEFLK